MIFPLMMKFNLGQLVIAPAVLTSVSVDEICRAIDRHVCGKWGDVSDAIRNTNENALLNGGQLLSVFHAPNETELRVLTTNDRLTTTVHLPNESGHQRTPIEFCMVTRDSAKKGFNCDGVVFNVQTSNCSAI
jgi:hypothetical protein